MKKIVFFLLIILIPFCVSAVDPDYDVEGYFAVHQVNTDGSVTVREAIVLSGDMNGYERQLLTSNNKLTTTSEIDLEHDSIYNPKGIKNLKVSAFKVDRKELNHNIVDRDITYSELKDYANVGEDNVYTLDEKNNSHTIRNYYSCTNCTVAFYFEYTLEGLTVIHNDVAEIYYQMFTYSYVTEDMGIIDIEVLYPDSDEEALMWVHGNVYGEVKKNDSNSWLIHSDKFTKGSELDYRTVFSKSLILDDTNLSHSNIEALPTIKEIEKRRDEERQKEIARILQYIKIIKYAGITYIILLILFIISIYFKYDKEHKVDFNVKYYREFIEDYDVEVIDYLMNKRITPNAMSASIMNLIYKKNIKAEPTEGKKDEYLFTLQTEEGLSANETKLVNFLFKKVGDGNTFTTKKLKDYAKSTKTYDDFTSSYNSWEKAVKKVSEEQEFFEDKKSSGARIGIGIYLFLGFLLWLLSINTIDDFIITHLLLVPIVIALIYILSFTKRSEKGALHYKKWTAFKNFLNDFGKFDIKELPEIILWERYLVYATIFGLADKVQKAMNVKIKEMDKVGGYDTSSFGYYYGYSSFSHTISHSIAQAHSLAVSTAAAQNASNSGGHGGGFSGGGGFGGGGGGGHGF